MIKDSSLKSNKDKRPPFAFYVILMTLPVLFFILLEISLRMVGYGINYTLFTKVENSVPGMIYVNPEISIKYFGKTSASVFSSSIGFYENKPAESFRIFVLGGSSAQGFPYNPQASFPSHLQRRLDLLYPERLIEVINLGASAINTYTLLDLLPEVLEQSPDLILIYAGHNEYYGALGAASSRSIRPLFARTLLYLRDFRMVQLIENTISSFSSSKDPKNKNLMQDMIGQSFIELGSSTYEKGINQFDENLSSIIEMINKAKVPVVLGTVVSNIGDHRPFNSEQVSNEGLSANDYYSLGKELYEKNDSVSAKVAFNKAKEFDGLRFRAPEKINTLIKAKAKEYDVPLVDIEEIFDRNSPLNITGKNLMCDHLHPNLAGYFLMSKAYYDLIQEYEYLPKPVYDEANNTMKLDSVLLAKFPYTYFDSLIDTHVLLSGIGQYPFVPLGQPNPYQQILDNDGIYFKSTAINEIDSIRTILAKNYLLTGDSNAFSREMNVFVSYFPQNDYRYLHAINLLAKYRVLNQGYPLIFNRLKSLKESNAKTKSIGLYYKFMGTYDSALNYLEKARAVTPEDSYLHLDIGFIHLEMENYELAIEDFSKAITYSPNSEEAYHQRAVARFEVKDYAGTIEDLDKSISLKSSPDTLSYLIRGYAQLGVNDQKSACEDWKRSAELGSINARRLYESYCNNQN